MRWLIALFMLASPAAALDCEAISYQQKGYTICRMTLAETDLRLFLNDPDTGKPLGSFRNVDDLLAETGHSLQFAMNAGMYHSDRRPVGHYVEDGNSQAPLITSAGPGNFGLLPNGVFCIDGSEARVYETRKFDDEAPNCRFATQSGPMLVINGELHPRFLEDSDSFYIRNGVGTSADGKTVWFAISDEPVNFHSFGSLFRDHLGTPQALYFDGNISRLYAPGIGRHDVGFPMGPIVGAVKSRGD
jgi:uncharacterized protein YigE (DUF2233 family)